MKKIMFVLAFVFVLGGCAFFRQAGEDYRLNRETPIQPGEISPQQQSATLVNTLSGIPYVNLAMPVVAILGPVIFGWLRGRRLRKNTMPSNSKPITGTLGENTGIETLVQGIANITAGLFDVGSDGSGFRRFWKITALSLPVIHWGVGYLTANPPSWLDSGILASSVGALAFIEKQLSKVQPDAPRFSATETVTTPPVTINPT